VDELHFAIAATAPGQKSVELQDTSAGRHLRSEREAMGHFSGSYPLLEGYVTGDADSVHVDLDEDDITLLQMVRERGVIAGGKIGDHVRSPGQGDVVPHSTVWPAPDRRVPVYAKFYMPSWRIEDRRRARCDVKWSDYVKQHLREVEHEREQQRHAEAVEAERLRRHWEETQRAHEAWEKRQNEILQANYERRVQTQQQQRKAAEDNLRRQSIQRAHEEWKKRARQKQQDEEMQRAHRENEQRQAELRMMVLQYMQQLPPGSLFYPEDFCRAISATAEQIALACRQLTETGIIRRR
jgi:flagellar biosynthesis GTPase FlhF